MNLLFRILEASLIYIAFLGLVYLLWAFIDSKRKESDLGDSKTVTLEILVPKNNEKGPLAAENFFATLHGIYDETKKDQDKVSFEIVSKAQNIKFYVHAPLRLRDFIEGQIYAQYPTVEISEVEDYARSPGLQTFAGAELVLNKNEVFPIKTFDNFEVDPLSGITGVISKVAPDEEIWLQMVVSPVPDVWQKKGIDYIEAIRSGKSTVPVSFGASLLRGAVNVAGEVIKTAAGGQTAAEGSDSEKEVKLSGPEEVALSGIETKVSKLGFKTQIRIISFSNDEIGARSKVTGVVGTFKQFNMTNLNGFSCTAISTEKDILQSYVQRSFSERAYILNIQELASIYHLPSETVNTPSISWAGSKKGEPPGNLPVEGSLDSEEVTIFAQTNYRHMTQRFGIKNKDRRLHLYAIGKTGTGKSTMLENMIINDIRKGSGIAVVDPHGDLIEHILEYIPKNRIKDVVYFSPSDREYPIGFNIMESVDPDLKTIVASGVVGIFEKIFGSVSWGPRLEYILRNTVIALLDFPKATMLDITRMLVDKAFRFRVVDQIKDPVIKNFWVNEFEKYDQKFRTEAVSPIQNKVGQFLSSSTIRNIVGQPSSTFNIDDVMNNKKILLLNLSIGKVGEDSAALLGAMMITKIQLSAMNRAALPEEKRIDFYLYVDEFQNFATDSFATILSEARKYKLNLIMTNQYIAQIPETVQKAVFGNVGTIVSFRVGAQDAAALAQEFEPVFDSNDLVNLDNYHIYIKMAIDGVTGPAFSAVTLPPVGDRFGYSQQIIESSRQKYARKRGEVEKQIASSLNETLQDFGSKKVKYPRQFNQAYIELKDPETGKLFYLKGKLEEYSQKDGEDVKDFDSRSSSADSASNFAKSRPVDLPAGSPRQQNENKKQQKKGILSKAIRSKSKSGKNENLFDYKRASRLSEEEVKKRALSKRGEKDLSLAVRKDQDKPEVYSQDDDIVPIDEL